METYPRRIRIRNVSDTDTPPPRSIRVTELVGAFCLFFPSKFTEQTEYVGSKWVIVFLRIKNQ